MWWNEAWRDSFLFVIDLYTQYSYIKMKIYVHLFKIN